MDENTWRIAQVAMAFFGIQTTIIIALFGAMWSNINKRLDRMDARLEKMEKTITEIDKRVFGIETMLHMKECCLLSEKQKLKKVE